MKLRERAYDAFTQHLLERRLLPGQFVSQRELAELTQMSLAAIREMIPRLEADGLIKAVSQRGLQIMRIDLRMVHDAFGLREMIEAAAIAAFVRRAADDEIRVHRERLERITASAAKAVTPELLDEAQAADWALHDAFVGHLGNRLVADLHRVNSIRIRMILRERIGISAARIPVALSEHAVILDALTRRDEAAAVAALRSHLASSRRRALDFDSFDAEGG
jgi:DNA-binding GntR family transcriptional regulator